MHSRNFSFLNNFLPCNFSFYKSFSLKFVSKFCSKVSILKFVFELFSPKFAANFQEKLS